MACPITTSLIRAFDHWYDTRANALYEDYLDGAWQELGQRAEADEPIAETVTLRALYVVEMVYHKLIPLALTQTLSYKQLERAFAEARFPRSTGGMKQLKEFCERNERAVVIAKGVLQMTGQKPKDSSRVAKAGGMTKMVADRFVAPAELMTLCGELADLISASLRGRELRGTKVGELLFQSLKIVSGAHMTRTSEIANVLLSISIHNPVSPWQNYPRQ